MRHASALLTAVPFVTLTTAIATVGDGKVPCGAFPCGHNENKVLLCHVADDAHARTLCLNPNAAPSHLENHEGDHCGECAPGGEIVYVGDLDGDHFVGITDLAELMRAWGGCADCIGDLEPDGIVDFNDLVVLLMNWD